jgi:acetyl-CoA acetyltransferase family protein
MSKNRVAIVGGVRTPFVKAGTSYSKYSFQDLSSMVLASLVEKYDLDAVHIDEVIWGTVLLDPRTPNWAREILFQAGLPKSVYAYSVSNNCISGLVALTCAAERISSGRANMSITGGAESMSNPSLLFNDRASNIFKSLFQARTLSDRLKLMIQFRPKDFLPNPPSVTEPSTGLTMGQHMELTAKELKIDRSSQDEVAFRSHQRAAAATNDGRLKEFLMPVDGIDKDLLIRGDTTLEKLSTLKPVFDRSSSGTLTAGNSSPLTDGAAAVLLLSEDEAKRQEREVLAYVSDYEYSAIDPKDGLLMAPAVAVPRLLMRNNLTLKDFDLVEIHEAFGAQVVANEKAWSEGLKEEAVGTIDSEKVNVLGGSIAIGHPFAATGGRIVMHLASEMKRRDAKRGLVSICAAGAMAGALILERH